MSVHQFFETHGRTLAKTLTWKLIATIISFSVSYYETGNVLYAIKFSSLVFIIGVFAYYLHERAWNSIHWGRAHAEQPAQSSQ